MNKFAFLVLFFAFLVTACKEDDATALLLHGDWNAISWKVRGQESGRDFASIKFSFKADGLYSASFSNQKESGTYKLKGDKLYTTGENKIEKMVKLTKLTADTIVMDMNRVGDSEELVLVKKK